MTARIQVHLFARYRELFGQDVLEVALSGPTTVAELRQQILAEHPELLPLMTHTIFAVNREFADEDRVITPADEVALIPPVSGG